MKIEDIIDKMSKHYLDRIAKSVLNYNVINKDEEGYREQIRSNINSLSDEGAIKKRILELLNSNKDSYNRSILITFILKTLLSSSHNQSSLEEIIQNIKKEEQKIITDSKDKNNFKHIDDKSLMIFETILSAAFDDDLISDDELHLIDKVRNKLSIQKNDQFLIQAKLNQFPQKSNKVHDDKQINQGLNDLQKAGVVFYGNKMETPSFVIPEEIASGVKRYLDIELIDNKYIELLDKINTNELRDILSNQNLKTSGTKEQLISRTLLAGIKPSIALDMISNERLSEICKKLPEVKSSGTKSSKIKRIIKYFDELVNIDLTDIKDQREVFYKTFEQLAKRDMSNLLGKKIVRNEKEAENAFEEATTYIFEKKLNLTVVKQKGTEHSDGCIKFNNSDELMLWDNKSKFEDKYKFPNSHLRQFKRYIRDYHRNGKRVNCFLIIVPEVDTESGHNAIKLKYESGTDTDVAIIRAEDLKWITEYWNKNYPEESFNMHIFNKTGILTRNELKERVKLFVS